jgi:glycosyltransferase involved in cell wall biosynthesis
VPSPLISLVLAVKNGWPHVKTAIDAIRRQTYPQFELVVQDGASTDGTLEYLASLSDIPALRLASAPDTGIGQAYNRGLLRSTGDLICFVGSDEYLEDDALERAITWWKRYPDAVYVNGAVRLTDLNGEVFQLFESAHFDLVGHLRCEVVLAFAGLLNRRKIGADLHYDEVLRTCPDYDFWIRLGIRFPPSEFVVMREVFKTARADRTSMSYRAEGFPQFCRDKLFVLNRFLDTQDPGPVVHAVRVSASAGIFLWAAESVFQLEGPTPLFLSFCERAAALDPWSPRLLRLAAQSAAFVIDGATGRFAPDTNIGGSSASTHNSTEREIGD